MAVMNVTKLVEIAQKSELARAIFKTLADMGKSRPSTDLGRFKSRVSDVLGQHISNSELLKVFKDLQDAGCGKLILSRNLSSAPHRFQWSHNNVEVGRAGVLNGGAVQAAAPAPLAGAQSVVEGSVVVSYPIRGKLYSIQLPQDLTKGEAAEVCSFINRFGR